jgi:hypothetical protein
MLLLSNWVRKELTLRMWRVPGFLSFVQCPDSKYWETQRFGNWICFRTVVLSSIHNSGLWIILKPSNFKLVQFLHSSGSGFPSNATLFWIFYSVTAVCFGRMTIFRRKYIHGLHSYLTSPRTALYLGLQNMWNNNMQFECFSFTLCMLFLPSIELSFTL